MSLLLQRRVSEEQSVKVSVEMLKHNLFCFYSRGMIKNYNTLLLSSLKKRDVKQLSSASWQGKGSQKYKQCAKWTKFLVFEGQQKSSRGVFFGLNSYYFSDTCQYNFCDLLYILSNVRRSENTFTKQICSSIPATQISSSVIISQIS